MAFTASTRSTTPATHTNTTATAAIAAPAKSNRLRRISIGLAAALLITTATACESGYSSSSRSALPAPTLRAERNPIDREAYAALGYRLQWRGFAVMGASRGVDHAALIGDGVALLTKDSILTYIDAATGEFRWADQPATSLTRFLGITQTGSRMIVAAESEIFIYETSSSNLEDRQRLDTVISTKPFAAGDFLVCGTPTGAIFGHFLPTGFSAWGNALSGAIETPPTDLSGAVAVASATGQIIVLDPRTGISIGRNSDPLDGTSVPLATSASALFIASRDQSLYGIAADGQRLWRIRTEAPLQSPPTHHAGRVYCTLPARGLTAIEASTGQILWNNNDIAGEVIAVRQGRLISWNRATANATLIDAASGDILESVTLQHIDHLITDKFEDGNLYIVSPLGVVSKFVPR